MGKKDNKKVPASFRRIEHRFPIADEAVGRFASELKGHVPVQRFDGDADWTFVRTLYLDSPALTAFRAAEEGQPARGKIRIRRYGCGPELEHLCWVELKQRFGQYRLKRRFCCPMPLLADLLKGSDIRREVVGFNPPDAMSAYETIAARIGVEQLAPVVRIDYERIAFGDPGDSGLRITIDRAIRYTSATREESGLLGGLVIEMKREGKEPKWFSKLCDRYGLARARGYSKFRRSMRKLVGSNGQNEIGDSQGTGPLLRVSSVEPRETEITG